MKNISSTDNINEGIVVLKFSADWCGPCRAYTPIMENVSKQYDDVKFFNVNVDQNGELAGKFGVANIPCTIVLKNGNAVSRMIGLRNARDIMNAIAVAQS